MHYSYITLFHLGIDRFLHTSARLLLSACTGEMML